MPKTCAKWHRVLDCKGRDGTRALTIEYEATLAAMEALLHHYRILALRLEQLVAHADDAASPEPPV